MRAKTIASLLESIVDDDLPPGPWMFGLPRSTRWIKTVKLRRKWGIRRCRRCGYSQLCHGPRGAKWACPTPDRHKGHQERDFGPKLIESA